MNNILAKLPARYWVTILLALVTALIFGWINVAELLPNAVPWGIIVLILTAWLGKGTADALRIGAVFGFSVSYAYLWFDNRNIHAVAQVLILIPLILLPALFGLLCGAVIGYLGARLRRMLMRK